MTNGQWQRVNELVDAALARPPAEREAFIREACADDSAVVADVLSMLAHEGSAGKFLEPSASNRAPLEPGRLLGAYRIEALIGAGGMGEVYRASDTRLPRTVALKVLPSHVRAKPQLLARFEGEARAIAALNHPYICVFHDIGQQDNIDFLVLEHIEGETLRERLRRGPLTVGETVRYACQIAEALAAAHREGLVHRDIKPSNIVVTTTGHVKVIDFGLARLTLPSAGEDVTREVTEPGALVGTPDYMSPEQARGLPPDPRTDIFALGIVLFECLTGLLPFQGETPLAVVAAILKDSPPAVTALKPTVPESLSRIVRRCLAKDASERYQSALELRNELEGIRNQLVAAEDLQRVHGGARALSRRSIGFGAATMAVAAAGAILYLILSRAPEPPRYTVRQFANSDGVEGMPAWSPDGLTLAYAAEIEGYYQIFTRPVDGSIPTPIPLFRLEADCLYPVWDSKGTRIFFLASSRPREGAIRFVSSAGGPSTLVLDDALSFALASDDSIVFIRRRGETLDLWKKDFAGERRVGSLREGLAAEGSFLRFSPDGRRLAIGLSHGLMLIEHPFDSAALLKSWTVQFNQGASSIEFFFTFAWMADSRRVVFSGREGGNGDPQLWLGDVDRGSAQPLRGSAQWELMPAVSDDRVAFVTTPLNWDIYQVTLESDKLQPLINFSRDDSWPAWVPGRNELMFSTMRTGSFEIWKHDLDRNDDQVMVTPEAFPDGPSLFLTESSVSPNGERMAFTRYLSRNVIRIYLKALQGKQSVRLTNAPTDATRESNPAWSPDGDEIVYRSGPRILKASTTGEAAPTLLAADAVPTGLTAEPKWVGDQIVYQSPEGLRALSAGGVSVKVSPLQPLVWDPAPDGSILAILGGKNRTMELVRIDPRSGAVIQKFSDLGRVPLTPDPLGYALTIRSLRVSPDGKRIALGYLQPTSDILILEGVR